MAYSFYDYGRNQVLFPKSDIYLKVTDMRGREMDFPIGDNIQNGNSLLVGTTRSGKTYFLKNMAVKLREAYPDDLFVFMDVKQDYINTLGLHRNRDQVVSYGNLSGTYNYFQWSIINEACLAGNYANAKLSIKEMVEVLFESLPEQGENQVFVESAKLAFGAYLNVFVGRIIDRIRTGKNITANDIPSNRTVIGYYNDMNFNQLTSFIKSVPEQRRLCDEVLPADEKGYPTKYAQSVLSIIRVFVALFDGKFCTEGKDTIVDFLKSEGRALFFEFDYSKQRSCAAFYRLILKKIIQEKMAIDSRYKNKKIYLFLDESAVLNGDFDLVNALNVGAGDGLRTIVSCQSIDHLYMQAPKYLNDHYGQAMIAGFSNVICFRPSDEHTMEVIQGKFGRADIEKMVMPIDRYQTAQTSVSTEYIVRSEQLASLEMGDAYVKLKAGKPVKVHFEEV